MLIKLLSTGALCVGVFAPLHAQTSMPAHGHDHSKMAPNPAAAPMQPMKPASAPTTQTPVVNAFKGYRTFNAKEPLVDWRAANDAMELLGGHMGHVRNKMTAADAPQGAAAQPANKAKP